MRSNPNEAVSVEKERDEDRPLDAHDVAPEVAPFPSEVREPAPETDVLVATLKADLHAALARADDLEKALGILVDHHSAVISDHHKAEVQRARVAYAQHRDEVKEKHAV